MTKHFRILLIAATAALAVAGVAMMRANDALEQQTANTVAGHGATP